jgi:cell cycle arrest protein BUB3
VHSTVTQALYTGSWDATVKVWDPRAGSNALQASVNQPDKVYSMDLAHHRLVVATNNQHIMVWDTRNMSAPEMKRESSLKHQTRCVRAYLDGTGFAIASTEGRVAMEFFDPTPAVQAKKYAFKCHRAMVNGVDHVYPVNALAFHPIYGTFASGGADGQVNIWDGANKKRLSQFRKYPAGISALAWNSDGTMLGIASSYTFEEGDRDHPPDDVYVRPVQDVELRPKPRSTAA